VGSDAAALSTRVGDDDPKEPLRRWMDSNVFRLVIYLALASFAAAVSSVIADDAGPTTLLGLTVIYFLYGGVFGIPGTIVWLLVVAIVPPEWSTLRRRAVALAISPAIQVIWLVSLLSWGYELAALVFGLLLPAGSAFVVRLRVRLPSSPWPPEDA
jgi:MFS family permease